MGFLQAFGNGLVFVSDQVFKHKGGYACQQERPGLCDKCDSSSGRFHAHGRYQRSLNTLRNWSLVTVRIWIERWLCLCCGRTMINPPPDVIPYVPNCTLVIAALLWVYLSQANGVHNALPHELADAAQPRSLARYLAKAKAVAMFTQQAIREALIQIKEPEPWDEGFVYGLSPPDRHFEKFREPAQPIILWRAIAMVLTACKTLPTAPCLIMARASDIMRKRKKRFLL